VALRVGTIHKAFDGVEAKYGSGRIFGRFPSSHLTEPRATAVFLQLSVEALGSDFGPLFGQSVFGTPGYDPAKYFPDAKLQVVVGELAQGWKEAQAGAPLDSTGSLREFVVGDWHSDLQFPGRFAAAVGKLQNAPALRATTLRYFGHASVPASERPRVGGPRALRQFRSLLINAHRLKEAGGFTSVLKRHASDYARAQGLDVKAAEANFPRIKLPEKAGGKPDGLCRYLETKLSQEFADISANLASYAIRDLARRGGGQLIAGTEHAFLADRDTIIFLQRTGIAEDVAKGKQLTVMAEEELREVHRKAFEFVQHEFIMTNAELSERMAMAARERLV
jgi:hypothetical protein